MSDFFTSDPHLFHELVASERGYASTDEHDQAWCQSISESVRPNDRLFILGDLTSGSRLEDALDVIGALPGKKFLIFGNHCPGHPMHKGAHNRLASYLRVFDWATPFAQARMGGSKVLLSHFPYTGDHPGREDRHTQWRLPDLGAPLIHGHTHQTSPWVPERPNQVCVSWDGWRRPAADHELSMLLGLSPSPAGNPSVEALRRTLPQLPPTFGA